MRLAVVAFTVIAATRAARADAPCPCPDVQLPPPAPELSGGKSPTPAIALSLGGTAAGIGLIALGGNIHHEDEVELPLVATGVAAVVLGPSFGELYAGRGWTPGLSMRAGGLLLGAVGFGVALQECGADPEGSCDPTAGGVIFLGGAALFIAGGVYDIVTAPRAARAWNASHAQELLVVPTALHDARGGAAPGLTVAGTF